MIFGSGNMSVTPITTRIERRYRRCTLICADRRASAISASNLPISVHERDTPITTKMLCAFASLRLCVEGIFTSGNMPAGTDNDENAVGTRIGADER